jgi:hypothetical protein
MKNTILKTIGAVLVGNIIVFVLSIGTDTALEKVGYLSIENFSSNASWVIVVAILCRCIYFIAGSFVTAKLAPIRPLLHAMILGAIGFLLGIVGAIMSWDKSPHWFPVTLALLPLPCAWIGGKLKKSEI